VPKLTASAPVLLTSDVVATSEYYRDKLGFDRVELFGEPANFAIVTRDGLSLMLAQKGRGVEHKPNWRIVDKTWNVYLWVDDVDGEYADMQARGAHIDYTIYNTPWGTREFGVQDLDDHDIAIGQVLD
jgi:catechol 2,3-dioxygenase-like lactoylglutathione lyase family enzyme